MHCAGYNSDTYDRYVLGLLEEPDRSQLEAQIQEQCPACLTGVQRSMNLWLVFAETLENAEPSEDFRGRIVRIAELSRKVLTFPKSSALRERSSVPVSTLLVICGVTCILLVATWYAGRASTRISSPPPSTPEIERLAQNLADSQLKLAEDNEKRQKPATDTGRAGLNARVKQLEDDLLRSQAETEQSKNALDRAKELSSQTGGLLSTFERGGTRVLSMKAYEGAGKGLGYAIMAPKSRVIFVGSNLPKPASDHQFQLWVLRKEPLTEVGAAVFTPDGGRSVVQFDDASLLVDVTGVLVTEEPIKGDYTKPSGPKLFEALLDEN